MREFAVLLGEGQDENKARKTARQYYAQFLSDKQISPKALELSGERTEAVVESTRFNPENGSL